MSQSDRPGKPSVHWAKRLKEEGDVGALVAYLEDPRSWKAAMAAEELADLGERRAVEPLYRRLRAMGRGPFEGDERGDWATLAAALYSIEGPSGPWADELLAMLREEDTPVGWYVGSILVDKGDRRVIEPMIESLAAADARSDAEVLKWETFCEALGDLRAVEAVEVLGAALPEAHWLVQEKIAYALMDIGDPRAVPALVAALGTRHGYFGGAQNAIWSALDEFATPEAKQAVEAYKRSLPKRRRFWFF